MSAEMWSLADVQELASWWCQTRPLSSMPVFALEAAPFVLLIQETSASLDAASLLESLGEVVKAACLGLSLPLESPRQQLKRALGYERN